MKLKITKIIWGLQFFASLCIGQKDAYFSQAYEHLQEGLEASSQPFKHYVFEVENAFLEGKVSRTEFDSKLQSLVRICKLRIEYDSINYPGKDYEKVEKNGSIFKTLTDTTIFQLTDTSYLIHYPFTYNFEDIWGSRDWRNMFVMKLLVSKKGNCHSLPYLYKILSDELGAGSYLSLAPNHIYIKTQTKKVGWFNTELTSATFPIDAWLMASGYISLQAVQNGIYLDTLSEKESIALCVLDLAQGYNHKYPDNDGKFVIECCDLALKHFPDYVNAILLKAETRLKQLQAMQKEMKYAYLKEVTAMPDGKAKWDEMNSLYMQLYKLGYRQMPEQMYVEWLTSLKTEKEKYSNKNAPGATKD
jgi:hypothetical protein